MLNCELLNTSEIQTEYVWWKANKILEHYVYRSSGILTRICHTFGEAWIDDQWCKQMLAQWYLLQGASQLDLQGTSRCHPHGHKAGVIAPPRETKSLVSGHRNLLPVTDCTRHGTHCSQGCHGPELEEYGYWTTDPQCQIDVNSQKFTNLKWNSVCLSMTWHRLRMFENIVLIRMLGPKREMVTWWWRKNIMKNFMTYALCQVLGH